MAVRSTVICDGCGQHYLLEDEELPPYWFAVQIIVADGEGIVPVNERESFAHFCSQECVAEYCLGDALREFAALVDVESNISYESEHDDEDFDDDADEDVGGDEEDTNA